MLCLRGEERLGAFFQWVVVDSGSSRARAGTAGHCGSTAAVRRPGEPRVEVGRAFGSEVRLHAGPIRRGRRGPRAAATSAIWFRCRP